MCIRDRSNNPWLLEMPDPITKATWDNYACVSPKKAFELGAELTSITEVVNAKKVIEISANGQTMKPVSYTHLDVYKRQVQDVRIGKHITLHVEAADKVAAEQAVKDACSKLLANPVMESYEFSITEG